MDTQLSAPAGPLYHGTRAAAAHSILHNGFRRSTSRNYTGTGVCLSESIAIAYEYGMYETGGCVLEARLAPTARWTDRIDRGGGKSAVGEALDRFFKRTGNDAIRTFGGNVWVVWNPAVLVSVRQLSHGETICKLCQEFDEDGPGIAYNGVVSDYASIWWGQQSQDPRMARFPEHEQTLRQRLQCFVGRSQSARIGAQEPA